MAARTLLVIVSLLAGAVAAPAAAQRAEASLAYYRLTPDPRMCPSPFCGGYFAERVNRRFAVCADGSLAPRCHAAEVEWQAVGLSEEEAAAVAVEANRGRVLVRGVLRLDATLLVLDRLVPTEVWLAGGETAPSGAYYRIRDNGIVCVTSPCFSFDAALLNLRRARRPLSALDLAATGADEEALEAARKALAEASLLVAGRVRGVPDAGPAGAGRQLDASQFYLRVAP